LAQLIDGNFEAVLFDLDGTLVDTAPDMVAVLQDLQRDHGIAPVAYELGRANVSNGALGLLRIAFPGVTDAARDSLLVEYLERYAPRVCQRSEIFAGLDELLLKLEAAARPWGVVTNKPGHLTNPLIAQLSLNDRIACVVSGDTLPTRKPDPAPLHYACEIAGIAPENTLYIGDAARDIEAGSRAGMGTIAAAYGYITADDDPEWWGANEIAADTAELSRIILKAVNLSV
jgi:phosphoglycolate phosphatase